MARTQDQTRPFGVTLLGFFFVLGMLASGLSAVSLLAPGGPLEPLWRLNPHAHQAFTRMGLWAVLLLLVVCLACAVTAFGLFRGTRLGHRLAIALLLLNLIGDMVNAVLGIEPRAVVGVPAAALLLWYLWTSRVRHFFSARA